MLDFHICGVQTNEKTKRKKQRKQVKTQPKLQQSQPTRLTNIFGYSYSIFNNYSITSGNAGHILVMINQKVKGKIGKKGQVVDSLVIDKNFSN